MPNQGRGVFSKDVDGDLQFYRADETAILRIGGDGALKLVEALLAEASGEPT